MQFTNLLVCIPAPGGDLWYLPTLSSSLPLPCSLVAVSSLNCLPPRMASWLHGPAVVAQSVPASGQSLSGGPPAALHLFLYLPVPRITPAGLVNSLPFPLEELPDTN